MFKTSEYNRLISIVNHFAFEIVNKRINSGVREGLFPSLCALCGGKGQLGRELCRGCEQDLSIVETACVQCGAPLPVTGLCGQCQLHPPAFALTLAVFHYQSPLDALVKRLKYKEDIFLARLLGELMADRLGAADIELPDVIVPVPLHVRRLRERGFNQALELARPIAERLEIPLDRFHVKRMRATDPQSNLPAKLRPRNVKGAFAIDAEFAPRSVAIVDDVMTTGHTVNELALMLRHNGVKEISVWVCARAVFRI